MIGPSIHLTDGTITQLKGLAHQPYQEPAERHDLGHMDIPCPDCNALHWADERLTLSTIANPKFSLCCDSGKVQLPLLQAPPPAILNLFTGENLQAKEFHDNIWKYN